MRNKFIILISVCLVGLTCSCQKLFLEKPDTTGTVDLDAIYSSSTNAEYALMACYRDVLIHGWPGGWGVLHGALSSISGENARGYDWHGTYKISIAGISTADIDGSKSGADDYDANWRYIRECFLVKENIDKVPDMSAEMKGYVKAEATALIAYRYMGMFYRYGGVPIVRGSFEANDDLSAPRASLQETLNYVIELCDEAYAGLPESKWAAAQTGRMTRGAVLAMKARALQYAARPLFNSATPYLDNGEGNNLICFGSADAGRWQDAIDANEAVLKWAAENGYELINTGGAGEGQPNPNAADDYGTATSTPSNREVLLAFKFNGTDGKTNYLKYMNLSPDNGAGGERWDSDVVGLLTNFLENYYLTDGSDLNLPKIGESMARNISEWKDNIDNIEPRAKMDFIFGGYDAFNNPGVWNWQARGWNRGTSNNGKEYTFPNAIGSGKGCGFSTKYYYKAAGRIWFEAPLFRLAETHLNLAEAYNEKGDATNALKHLNIVHNRAGLPKITETGQAALRKLIQREKAVEYYNENHRWFDVKHWKLENIGNGIIGGPMRELQFGVRNAEDANGNVLADMIEYYDAVTYESYWHPRMFLEPIPLAEVNKGFAKQNPGY